MGTVSYDVPLVTQAANPICWVACMAMVASERRGCSVGVGEFAGGFDPSNSSIPNPAASVGDFYRRLGRCGFGSLAINDSSAELESAMRPLGPLILTHHCQGFPYGARWAAITSATATHAVVPTAIDTSDAGWC